MKKIYLLTMLALALCAGAVKADDSVISSVTFSAESKVPTSSTTYTYTFTAPGGIPAYTYIYLFFYDQDGNITTTSNGVNVLFSEYSSNDLNISGYGHYIDASTGFIKIDEEHPAGTYSFTVTDAVNPGDEIILTPALSTTTDAKNYIAYSTQAEENWELSFKKNTADYISFISVSANDSLAYHYDDLTYTISTTSTLGIGDTIYFFFSKDNGLPADSGFDFSSASSDFGDNLITCEPQEDYNNAVFACSLYSTLPAGTSTLTISYAKNPKSGGDYTPIISLQNPNETSQYLNGSNLSIAALSKPGKLKNKKIKVKKLKKQSATLKWSSQSSATYYIVRLEKKNKKKYKLKQYYYPTTNNQKLNKTDLTAGTSYRIKIQACNQAGCSKWSKYRQFITKQ